MRYSCTYEAPSAHAYRAMQITTGNNKYQNLETTPGCKMVFEISIDIWILEADGSGQKQLTFEGRNNRMPSVCASGYIVYSSNRNGARRIWRMDIDGSNQKQLTSGDMENFPRCSPDGKWVLYASSASGV